MRFRMRFADQLVGVFVLVAIVGIAVILAFIGINQRWFARNYHFRSRFDSGGGLSVGMPIMLKGFEIGKVSRISLNESNQVDVAFYIQDTYYPKVLPNSVLQLTSSPIGLGTTLNFLPGLPGSVEEAPLPEGAFIWSLDTPEGRQLVEDGKVAIPKGEDVIGSVIAKVNPILDEVSSTLAQARRVITTVDLALKGQGGPVGDMVVDLRSVPTKANALIDDVNERVASITDQVNQVLAKIDTASANIQGITVRAEDALDTLTKDLDSVSSQAEVTIADVSREVKAISAQTQGTIASLSADLDAIAANVEKATAGLAETRGLATRLLDPKGSIATLLDDGGALYGQIESSLASVSKAVEEINGILAQVSEFVAFVNSTRPQISGLLETGKTTLGEGTKVLEAVKNNPLLRGGVTEEKEQQATLKSYRDEDF